MDESGGAGGSGRPQKEQIGGANTDAPAGLTANSPNEPNGPNIYEADPNTGESGESKNPGESGDSDAEPTAVGSGGIAPVLHDHDIIAVLCTHMGQTRAELGNLARINRQWRRIATSNVRVVRVGSGETVESALRVYQKAEVLQVPNVHSLTATGKCNSIVEVEIGDGWLIEEVRGFILDCVKVFPRLKVLNVGLCDDRDGMDVRQDEMPLLVDAIIKHQNLEALFADSYTLQDSDITKMAHGISALKAIVARRSADTSAGVWCRDGECDTIVPWSLGALVHCAPFKPNLRSVGLGFPLTDNVVAALSPYRLKMLSVHGTSASLQALRSLHSHNLDDISITSGGCTLSQLAALGHVLSISVDELTDGADVADGAYGLVAAAPMRTKSLQIFDDITEMCANVLQTFPLLECLECFSVRASPASLRRLGPMVSYFACYGEVTTDQLEAIAYGRVMNDVMLGRWFVEPFSARLCRALSGVVSLTIDAQLTGAEVRQISKHLMILQELKCEFEPTLELVDFHIFINSHPHCLLKVASVEEYAANADLYSALIELELEGRLLPDED